MDIWNRTVAHRRRMVGERDGDGIRSEETTCSYKEQPQVNELLCPGAMCSCRQGQESGSELHSESQLLLAHGM